MNPGTTRNRISGCAKTVGNTSDMPTRTITVVATSICFCSVSENRRGYRNLNRDRFDLTVIPADLSLGCLFRDPVSA